jgi:type IX secretion system PorP/SprF family membrane protein
MPCKINYTCVLIIFILLSINSFSQENSIYNNDYLDPFITNPACTGAEYYPVAHLSIYKQWLGFKDSPSTYLLSGNFRIGNFDFYDPKKFINKGPLKLRDRVGLGAAIFNNTNGPLSTTGGYLSYAYHLPVNQNSRLSFGLSLLMTNYAMKSSILKPGQSDDNYLLSGNNSSFKANFGFGIYYYSTRYFTGLSINKLLPGISNVNDPLTETPSYFFIGGYKFFQNNNSFNFEPSIALKKIDNKGIIVDIHSKLYIKKLNWIALSYSTSQKIDIQFGFKLYKMVYFGYKYGYTLSDIAVYNYGTHEISLGINLGLIGVEGIRETVN